MQRQHHAVCEPMAGRADRPQHSSVASVLDRGPALVFPSTMHGSHITKVPRAEDLNRLGQGDPRRCCLCKHDELALKLFVLACHAAAGPPYCL